MKSTLKKLNSLQEKGLVGKLHKAINFTDEPRFHQYFSVDPPYGEDDPNGVGFSDDESISKIKAMSEYIERKALENVALPETKDSYDSLENLAIDPARFVNFREVDLKNKKKEYLDFLRSSKLSWVKSENSKSGEEILIPSQLVYVPYDSEEPIIRPQVSTGAASHETQEKARLNGLLEVIERDSFILKFLSKSGSPKIILDGGLKNLEEYFKRYRLELNVFDITSDLCVPSYLCVNVDRTGIGPAVSMGAKSGYNPEEAIKGAMLESQQIRQWVRYCHLSEGQPNIKNASQVKSIKDRGFYWANLDRIKDVNFLDNKERINLNELNNESFSLEKISSRLRSKGIETYYVDITPKEISKEGFHVTKVVAPELHPLYLDEIYPCYESERLNKLLDGKEVNTLPVPFL